MQAREDGSPAVLGRNVMYGKNRRSRGSGPETAAPTEDDCAQVSRLRRNCKPVVTAAIVDQHITFEIVQTPN